MLTNALQSDDRGMSTVVGAILVVGITVVLAAIIGGFVFGIGDDLSNTQPQVQVSFDYNEQSTAANQDAQLAIIHDGGDTITEQNTGTIRITGDATEELDDDEQEFVVTSSPSSADDSDAAIGTPVTSGSALIESADGGSGTDDGVGHIEDDHIDNLDTGDTVNVIWVSNDGSQSNQLGSFTIPGDS